MASRPKLYASSHLLRTLAGAPNHEILCSGWRECPLATEDEQVILGPIAAKLYKRNQSRLFRTA